MAASTQQLKAMMPDWASGKLTLKEIKGYKDEELFALARMGYFFLMQGKNEDARALFEGLIAIDPRNDYYYRALGVIFDRLGDSEKAIQQFSYAIRINPDAPHAYVNRAEIYISVQQFVEAQADLQEALQKMSPRDQQLSRKTWALLRVASGREL